MTLKRITRDMAFAAGQDTANRRMKSEGRTYWNLEDWKTATGVFEKMANSPNYVPRMEEQRAWLDDANKELEELNRNL